MNRIKLILLPLLLLLAVGSQAMAQLEVFLSPARRDYMLGEKVELKVTIVNHTDSSVVLTSTPGRSWLYLEVSHRGEGAVVPTSIPRYPNLTIMPGSRKSYTISLQPHFRLVREGTYRVRATLRMPDMSTAYSSNSASVNLAQGGTVRNYVVQARGQRLDMAVKSLSMGGRVVLFGQVMNADTRLPIGACPLGPYLNFMPPRILLDRAQNLHVLFQTSAEFFVYAVIDTFGSRRDYKVLKRTGGPVDLISSGKGIRWIGLAPYVKPKLDDQYHDANERP